MATDSHMGQTDEKDVQLALVYEVVKQWTTKDENFMIKLRDAEDHPLLDDFPSEGPASVDAVDKYAFVLVPFLAQFAATGLPTYSAFKAMPLCG